MRRFPSRIRRAFRMEAALFEEVEHDHGAGGQAFLVVLLASTCAGVGNAVAARLLDLARPGVLSVLLLSLGFVLGWIVWSFVTMAVGTTLFGGRADMGEMQRALGFAAAPGMLMLVPGLGVLVGVPWSLVTMVIAVRQALDFSMRQALLTVLVAAVVAGAITLPPVIALAWRL